MANYSKKLMEKWKNSGCLNGLEEMDVSDISKLIECQAKQLLNEKNNTMKVRIKKLHSDAVIPKYANVGDAGMDLTAVSKEVDDRGNVVYRTGLAYEIPEGYVGLIFPRSSVSKLPMTLSNSVGVIDSGYRGEIMFKFKPTAYYSESVLDGTFNDMNDMTYNVGDRIGQMIIIPYPQIDIEETESFSESSRGHGGFGSTGN